MIWKIKAAAARPYLADGTTPNPLWPWIIEARAFASGRFRIRGNQVIIENDDSFHGLSRIVDLITTAESNFGAGALDVRYPCWMRTPLAMAGTSVPAWFPVSDVVDDPGDPTADPPVDPTYRRPTVSELHLYREIDGFGWAPCSDGQDYFWMSDVLRIEAIPSVWVIESSEVPQAAGP